MGTKTTGPPAATLALNVPGAAHQFDQVTTLVTPSAPATKPVGNVAGLLAIPSSGLPPRSKRATTSGSPTVQGSPFALNRIDIATLPVAPCAEALTV